MVILYTYIYFPSNKASQPIVIMFRFWMLSDRCSTRFSLRSVIVPRQVKTFGILVPSAVTSGTKLRFPGSPSGDCFQSLRSRILGPQTTNSRPRLLRSQTGLFSVSHSPESFDELGKKGGRNKIVTTVD